MPEKKKGVKTRMALANNIYLNIVNNSRILCNSFVPSI